MANERQDQVLSALKRGAHLSEQELIASVEVQPQPDGDLIVLRRIVGMFVRKPRVQRWRIKPDGEAVLEKDGSRLH